MIYVTDYMEDYLKKKKTFEIFSNLQSLNPTSYWMLFYYYYQQQQSLCPKLVGIGYLDS